VTVLFSVLSALRHRLKVASAAKNAGKNAIKKNPRPAFSSPRAGQPEAAFSSPRAGQPEAAFSSPRAGQPEAAFSSPRAGPGENENHSYGPDNENHSQEGAFESPATPA